MNHRITVWLIGATATAVAVLASGATVADASPTAQTIPITLASQVLVPGGTTSAIVLVAPPKCHPHQSFVATALSGSPDPTATFANGVYQALFTPSWGATRAAGPEPGRFATVAPCGKHIRSR